jgi:hypothetical protein
MTDVWVWRAFDAYATSFQRLETTAYIWNPNKKQLMYSNETRKLAVHYFNIFCVTLTTFISTVIPVLDKLLSKAGGEKEQLPLWISLFYVVLILVWSFVIIGIISIHFQGQTMAQTTNALLPDTVVTANRMPADGKEQNKNMKNSLIVFISVFVNSILMTGKGNARYKYSDIIGMGLVIWVYLFLIYPFIIAVTMVWMSFDPNHFLIEWYLVPLFQGTGTLHLTVVRSCFVPIRFIFIYVSWHETFMFLIMVLLVTLVNILSTIQKLSEAKDHWNIERFIEDVNKLRIIYAPSMSILDLFDGLLMLYGLGSIVCLVFITIRMHTVLGYPMNIVPPSMILFVLFFIKTVLPPAVNIYEGCCTTIRKKLKEVSFLRPGKRRILRRRLRAIRPLQYHGGVFGFTLFGFERSTKMKYFEVLASYSIDLLLAVRRV